MRGAEIAEVYLTAAKAVLRRESGAEVVVDGLLLKKPSAPMGDLSVLVGVIGDARGVVSLGMDRATALSLAGRLLGTVRVEVDELAKSTIAELGNMIAGQGAVGMAKAGCETTITPPAIVSDGREGQMSLPNVPFYALSLATACGPVELRVAVRNADVA